MTSKDSVAWRVKRMHLDSSALAEEELKTLNSTFGIEVEKLERLSFGLAIALDTRRYPGREEVIALQLDKARKDVAAAVRSIDSGLKALQKAKSQLDSVKFQSPILHIPQFKRNLNSRDQLIAAIESAESYKRFLESAVRSNLVTSDEVSDRRQLRDERRGTVCKFIFEFWSELGRNVSYTTDPITSERIGPLISFVNAIIPMITDPPAQLSGESIKFEIDIFNARHID